MGGWMGGWMDGWMYTCMFVCLNAYVYMYVPLRRGSTPTALIVNAFIVNGIITFTS